MCKPKTIINQLQFLSATESCTVFQLTVLVLHAAALLFQFGLTTLINLLSSSCRELFCCSRPVVRYLPSTTWERDKVSD